MENTLKQILEELQNLNQKVSNIEKEQATLVLVNGFVAQRFEMQSAPN